MTIQRRRGLPVVFLRTETVTDRRSNTTKRANLNDTVSGRAWAMPDRSSKAEVPGQQQINVIRIGTTIELTEGLWARALFDGKEWDVAAPPAYHHGTRHTRHWSVELRERTVKPFTPPASP